MIKSLSSQWSEIVTYDEFLFSFISCISSSSSRTWLQKGETKANNVNENFDGDERRANDEDAGWHNMCATTSAASPWRFSLDVHWIMSSHTNFYFYFSNDNKRMSSEYFRSALIATHATIFSSRWCVTLERSFHRVHCVGGVHLWCGSEIWRRIWSKIFFEGPQLTSHQKKIINKKNVHRNLACNYCFIYFSFPCDDLH